MVCIAGMATLCGTAGVGFASVIDIANGAQLVGAADAYRYRVVADVDCTRQPVSGFPGKSCAVCAFDD
jgi:hypothetical protein